MATGANATPLGYIHPSMRGKGTQEEKLAAIETAKRVASQLFPGMNENSSHGLLSFCN